MNTDLNLLIVNSNARVIAIHLRKQISCQAPNIDSEHDNHKIHDSYHDLLYQLVAISEAAKYLF